MRTGIIRRVDDLGRVVIPREIRTKLGIKEGTPLEIALENDGVCFLPYSADASGRIKSITETIYPDDYNSDVQDEIRENLEGLRQIANNLERLGV